MSDTKEFEGTLKGFSVKKDGVKEDGEKWKLYGYEFESKGKKLLCSGFEDPSELVGKYLIVAYTEKPNPKKPQYPYKNVTNFTEGIAKQEADIRYNVNPVGEDEFAKGAFFGMCSNQALRYILHRQKTDKDFNYQKNFSAIFNIIWEENLKKRKEKLELPAPEPEHSTPTVEEIPEVEEEAVM